MKELLFYCRSENLSQLILKAAKAGNVQRMKRLVESGVDVNEKDDNNTTVLHYAARSGSLEMVKYLVEHGAMVTTEHKQGQSTVLYSACDKGNDLVVEYLLQHGAIQDIDDDEPCSPLSIACCKGHIAVVKTLLKYSVDVRKEKELVCGNDEIMDILKLRLKKSIKHQEKIQNLKAMDDENKTKVI